MAVKQISIFSEDFPPYRGGIAQWAFGVAHGLQRLGHEVRIFTRNRGNAATDAEATLPFSVHFIRGENWKQWRSWYCYRAIRSFHESGPRVDALIATTWNVARGLLPFARKHRLPLFTVIHGLEVTRRMPLFKRLWLAKTLKGSSRLIAVSAFTRERVLTEYGLAPEKIVVLPNGVDPARFFPSAGTAEARRRLGLRDEKVILTLARVIERKGHDQVLRALPRVKQQIPEIKYVIAGPWDDSYYHRLQRLVAELRLQSDVVFTGLVAPQQMNAMYNLCNVYIMPSRELAASGDTEGFGITFLEANACAKPVIGGRSGGVVDAIVDGETGFLVDPENPDEIAERLVLLLTNTPLAQQMGLQGRIRVERQFSWEAISKALANLILQEGGIAQ